MDWFEDVLAKGAEVYTAREGRKMEEAKLEQAALLNAAPKVEQPQAVPVDAKLPTTAPGAGMLAGVSPGMKTAGLALVGLVVGGIVLKGLFK